MAGTRFEAIVQHARDLQRATDLADLLATTRDAVRAVAGYDSVWLAAIEPGTPRMVRVLAVTGDAGPAIWERAPRFPVDGDPMLEAIARADAPVVVDDARTDPRTDKAMVALLGNRTIVNVPLVLGEERLGSLGTGTFGDEGVRPPSSEALEHLIVYAALLAAALQRVRLLEARRVAEREREQLNRRIESVQRMESLALLAGGVAHDFNNLLTVILNALQFVTEGPLDDAQRADLGLVFQAVGRARGLSHQLLAMGRRQALRLTPLDVDARAAELVNLIQRLFPANVRVTLRAGAAGAPVVADRTQLDQVLLNLCLNARDAMPDGGTLTLSTAPADVDEDFARTHPWARVGRFVAITVADTGVGMSPDVVARIFEPFFTTKAPGSGTGLGLAVTLGVVHQHGGFIHCASAVGAGTTFTVYLPLHEAPAPPSLAPPAAAPVGGTERVLVADDDDDVRAVVTRILARAGYHVTAVADGAGAIAAAEAAPFDLALLDVVMPRMSGRAAMERIRGMRPDIAVVFGSGYAVADAPRPAPGVAVLEKPYDPDGLLRAVRGALDARAARR